jgi:molybdenum cofactor guanylyltransferase
MITKGIVLAGGKSSRMGQNKALLEFNNKTVIEGIIEKLKILFDDVIIITNTPELFKFTGLKIYPDIYPGRGPLAGIHSGLFHSNNEKNFIISCDLPLISVEAIRYIAGYSSEKQAVFFKKNGHLQYLFGIYKKQLIPLLEESLKNENLRMMDFVKNIDAEIVEAENFPEEIFYNLNKPEDYDYIKKKYL